jgi:hypothetical protein
MVLSGETLARRWLTVGIMSGWMNYKTQPSRLIRAQEMANAKLYEEASLSRDIERRKSEP